VRRRHGCAAIAPRPRSCRSHAMPRLPLLALAARLFIASTAYAAEVYQWKDANGVTHYSQTPPPRGSYQQRQITSVGASAAPQAARAEAPADNPQCVAARAN